MTTKKTAARSSALPSLPQVMHVACLVVVDSLRMAIDAAAADWRDEYQDAINATEVAAGMVQRLQDNAPRDMDAFCTEWWRATSLGRLAEGAFPDKATAASRHLQRAVRDFEALFNVVDFLDGREGGAA